MAVRKPLVNVGGQASELPAGDTLAANALSTAAGATVPSLQKLLAWSFDSVAALNTTSNGNGVIGMVKIPLVASITVATILIEVTTAGATFTANANYAGLYDTAGNRLGVTADMSTTWNSLGLKPMALASPVSLTVPAGGGAVYAAILHNATTQPAFRRGTVSATIGNAGLGAADGYRFATTGSGITTLPATIAIGSMAPASTSYWVGLV